MAETEPAKKDELPMHVVTTADERKVAVEAEYTKYIAVQDINSPSGARAFNIGDPIPASTVEGGHCPWITKDSDAVATRNSAKAKAAVRQAGGLETE